ncbi:MAG: HdeD family acid-resistance protein [Ilumatobacter sp.]
MTESDLRTSDDTRIGVFMLDAAVGWVAVFTVSVISIVIGAMLLAWPGETITVLSVLLGLQFVVFGVTRLISAFDHEAPAPGVYGVLGVLMIGTGVIILRNRVETLAILATILGIVWIIGGVIDAIDALRDRHGEHRGLRVLRGLVSLVAGLVVVSWPTPTLAVLAWISGLQLLVFGVIGLVVAWSLRRSATAAVV